MDYRKEFRIDPDTKFKLHKLDPAFTDKHEEPDEAKKETEVFAQKLFRQQALLHAEHKHSILVVLQALDAGGKDGTIKHVFAALNPQGVSVAAFKQPTSAELAHDFLWRVHPHAPGEGEIVIFNRSHYEDVLVTRVHKLIDKATWTALPGDDVIRWQRERCGKSEEAHAVMKDDLAGGRLPSGLFGANAAWWAIMVLAHNLNALMKHRVLGGDWAARRMKAMRFHLIALPGRVVRHARRLIVRLSAGALDLIRDVRAAILALQPAPSG